MADGGRTKRIPRWRRQPDSRPGQILEAAFRVFGARGLHQATLDDVAREAGITKGTIYLYFPSKAALFSAMLKSRVNAVMPEVSAPHDRQPAATAHTRLHRIGRQLYAFFRSPAYLAMFRAVVSEVAEFPEAAELIYREGILTANRRLAEVIRQGVKAGEFRGLDPMIAARAFTGMFLIFAVSQGLLGGERIYPIPEAKVVRTVTDIFFNGLLVPGEPRGASRAFRKEDREPRTQNRAAEKRRSRARAR
jgi:AcrR family transcriptional regulator